MNATGLAVAVVDDEASVRRALGRLLRSAGYPVEDFEAGEPFLLALDERRFGCVVLDLHMPGVDGFEVLTRIGRLGHRPPVIVLTGHDSPESRARVAEIRGETAFLRKPIDGEVLLQAVETALEAGQGERERQESKP